MKCTQSQLSAFLPPRIRTMIPKERWEDLLEIRMRLGAPPQLVGLREKTELPGPVTGEELQFCVNTASRYSPWSAASIKDGYLTAPGGHRIGICGSWTGNGFGSISGLCIRVARDFPGISQGIPLRDSILVLGPPGSGKTTLLRDMIQRLSKEGGGAVAVVDERCELFPAANGTFVFPPGINTDVLSACAKPIGIPMVLRSMGPAWIALDEITAESDCAALLQAGWCGVRLIATAHASDVSDLISRPVYEPLVKTRLFRTAVVLGRDKSWHMERISL